MFVDIITKLHQHPHYTVFGKFLPFIHSKGSKAVDIRTHFDRPKGINKTQIACLDSLGRLGIRQFGIGLHSVGILGIGQRLIIH